MDLEKQAIEIIKDLPNQILEYQIMWVKVLWDSAMEFLISHWLVVLLTIIITLVISVINFLLTGRWGMMASILYRIFYFGTLFVIILVFGVEIIVTNNFQVLAWIIGIVVFETIGFLIRKFRP